MEALKKGKEKLFKSQNILKTVFFQKKNWDKLYLILIGYYCWPMILKKQEEFDLSLLYKILSLSWAKWKIVPMCSSIKIDILQNFVYKKVVL